MKILALVAIALVPGASAYAATQEAEVAALQTYCKPDVQRLCKGVSFGGGAVQECLKKNEMQLSVGCAKALKALKK